MNKDQILKETIELYRSCKTFRAEVRFIAVRMDFKARPVVEIGVAFRTWFSRPYSWRLEWAPIMPQGTPVPTGWSTLVGDQNFATILNGKNKESFQNFDEAVVTNPFADQLFTLGLLTDMSRKHPLDEVKGTAMFPMQEIDGRSCHHLVVHAGKNMDEIHLWIDTSSNVIRKVERAMTPFFRAPLQLVFRLFEKVSHTPQEESTGGLNEFYDDVELNPLIHPAIFKFET